MADNLLPPNTDPTTPPPMPQPSPVRRITCDCCGCALGADGGVLKTGDRAREMARADEKIEQLKADLAKAQRETEDARTELATVKAQLTQATGGGDDHDDI